MGLLLTRVAPAGNGCKNYCSPGRRQTRLGRLSAKRPGARALSALLLSPANARHRHFGRALANASTWYTHKIIMTTR